MPASELATDPSHPYPRFSDAEMRGRGEALADAIGAAGAEYAILYGSNRFGSAIPWLTGWPVTREAVVVLGGQRPPLLLVDFYNHVPTAERIATEAEVRWAGESILVTALDDLRRRGATSGPIAVVGQLPFQHYRPLAGFAGADGVVDLTRAYLRLRLVKSAEEIEWTRRGAALTDRSLLAVRDGLRAGVSEDELCDLAERAYVAEGGRTHIHYFGITSMSRPQLCVPSQWPGARRVDTADAVSCELSASFWDYPGQVLRTFAVGAEPTAQYEELHAVAEAAFDAIVARLRPGASAAELVDASQVIEDAGYTIRDDLVHGFVGGYLPPVLGSASRQLTAIPEFTFEPGMMVVVQPNVVTSDETAGVQTGGLVLVTADGHERLHHVPGGLIRVV